MDSKEKLAGPSLWKVLPITRYVKLKIVNSILIVSAQNESFLWLGIYQNVADRGTRQCFLFDENYMD